MEFQHDPMHPPMSDCHCMTECECQTENNDNKPGNVTSIIKNNEPKSSNQGASCLDNLENTDFHLSLNSLADSCIESNIQSESNKKDEVVTSELRYEEQFNSVSESISVDSSNDNLSADIDNRSFNLLLCDDQRTPNTQQSEQIETRVLEIHDTSTSSGTNTHTQKSNISCTKNYNADNVDPDGTSLDNRISFILDADSCGNKSADGFFNSPDVSFNRKQKFSVLARKSSWKKVMNVVQCTSSLVHLYQKKKYPWIQLAGHQGNFVTGNNGTIMKMFCPKEYDCFLKLRDDVLSPHIPQFHGLVERDGNQYVLLEDLLSGFRNPNIMDIKIGLRTYLEEELTKASKNPEMRNDMYVKMIAVDETAPTLEEHAVCGITKPRYLKWRDTISSSSNLGFRIEGICMSDGSASTDFKFTKERNEVSVLLKFFMKIMPSIITKFLERLNTLRDSLMASTFFFTHEVVGSSLLFLYDKTGAANVYMIDFGKSTPLPDNVTVDHRSEWIEGNREDGYLLGLDNLVEIMSDMVKASIA